MAQPHRLSTFFSYPKLVFLMEESVVDIGPKLFEDGRACVDQNVRHPELIGLSKGALLAGIVKARDARGRTRPKYL
jgi:hypothetical protein